MANEPSMLFVVGCPRSGTTWLNDLIGAHPEVCTGPESHAWIDIATALDRPGPLRRKELASALSNITVSWHRRRLGVLGYVSESELDEIICRSIAAGGGARQIGERIVEQTFATFLAGQPTDRRLVLEKTPSHVIQATDIMRRFPQARMIEIVRDGRDVAISLLKLDQKWAPDDLDRQIDMWTHHVRAGQQLRNSGEFTDRLMTVNFEALKADPATTLDQLLQFADLDRSYVSAIVEAHQLERHPDVGEGKHRRAGSVGGWRDAMTSDQIEQFARRAGTLLEDHGYDLR